MSELPPRIDERRWSPDQLAYGSAIALGLVTVLIQGFRLSAAPDVFGDEAAYTLVGKNLAEGLGLMGRQGIFLWHGPFYFVLEAIFLKLGGFTHLDLLSTIFLARWLNVVVSGATTGVLVVFGYRLRSLGAGLLMGVIFLLDPYVMRINRRSMLETLVIFLVLLGFCLFLTYRGRRQYVRWLASGFVFGLAVLSKEPAALEMPVLLGISLWGKPRRLGDAVRAGGVALATYLPYPIWMVAAGYGSALADYKWFNVERITHAINGAALPPPPEGGRILSSSGVLSIQNLLMLLHAYATSYLLFAAAGVGIVILFLGFRHVLAARFLVLWGAYSLALGLILVRISDQYFYFLAVPCVMVCGYLLDAAFSARMVAGTWRRGLVASPLPSATPTGWLAALLLFLTVAALAYDSYDWLVTYGRGWDNGYTKVVEYVRATVPRGTTIVSSDEVPQYLLEPDYDVRLDRDIVQVRNSRERYFILSSRDAWTYNQGTTPSFYDWVIERSQPLMTTYGNAYWELGLYYRSGG